MDETPVIHVLSKEDPRKHFLVPLPDCRPYPSLEPSSRGHLFGWWDFHLLPPSIPPDYADAAKYGRVSAWGYGEVMESTSADIAVGDWLYGYLPIGTLPVDLQLKRAKAKGQYMEISYRRRDQMSGYNRYSCFTPAQIQATTQDSLGWDSLMKGLFETSFNLNRHVLGWEKEKRIRPFAADGPTLGGYDDSKVRGALVFIFAASGKAALSFAHQLKHARPSHERAKCVVAITSTSSLGKVAESDLYDHIFLYDQPENAKSRLLDSQKGTKIFFADFGARGNATAKWFKSLQPNIDKRIGYLCISGVVDPETTGIRAMASGMRDQAMALLGEDGYFEAFESEWVSFKEQGGLPGVELVWHEGMERVADGWQALCQEKVGPGEGLLYRL